MGLVTGKETSVVGSELGRQLCGEKDEMRRGSLWSLRDNQVLDWSLMLMTRLGCSLRGNQEALGLGCGLAT